MDDLEVNDLCITLVSSNSGSVPAGSQVIVMHIGPWDDEMFVLFTSIRFPGILYYLVESHKSLLLCQRHELLKINSNDGQFETDEISNDKYEKYG